MAPKIASMVKNGFQVPRAEWLVSSLCLDLARADLLQELAPFRANQHVERYSGGFLGLGEFGDLVGSESEADALPARNRFVILFHFSRFFSFVRLEW